MLAGRKSARLLIGAIILLVITYTFFADIIYAFFTSENQTAHEPKKTITPPVASAISRPLDLAINFDEDEDQVENEETAVAVKLVSLNFRPDGLVEVHPDGPHPIHHLIAQGEKVWQRKHERQSTTLDEAVKEYRRRYGRDPPLGFDRWWHYARDNNVQLPDEYDQIYHDMEPFWGIEPTDLLEIQKELELKKDSYTLGHNEEGKLDVLTYAFEEGSYNNLIRGSDAILDLLREIESELPKFRATFSPHDGPNRLSDYSVYKAVMEAAAAGRYIERKNLPEITPIGWVSACSPSSPGRAQLIDLDHPPPRPRQKTFIHDHRTSMDPCLHPEHLHHHGQFLSHNQGPTPQHAVVPEFSACSTTIHHNIRIPTPYGWISDILPRSDDPEWDEKLDERLLWRGSNTGMHHSDDTRWQGNHRDFMVGFTNALNGTTNLLRSTRSGEEKVGKSKEVRNSRLNPAVMDTAFAGQPIACSDGTCEYLRQIFPWREYQGMKAAGNYKYVLDIDGNGWSGRFKRLITSNSLIFKTTIYPEWYMDRVQPWVHYIPIQLDLSDLHDALVFFRGDPNGEGAHEDLAKKIAVAGRTWSKTYWRREDMVAYFFRLMLEYTRLMSLDRDAMTYKSP